MMTGSVFFACFCVFFAPACLHFHVDHHVLALRVARTLHILVLVACIDVLVVYDALVTIFGIGRVVGDSHVSSVSYNETLRPVHAPALATQFNATHNHWVKALNIQTSSCFSLALLTALWTPLSYPRTCLVTMRMTLSPTLVCSGKMCSNRTTLKRASAMWSPMTPYCLTLCLSTTRQSSIQLTLHGHRCGTSWYNTCLHG